MKLNGLIVLAVMAMSCSSSREPHAVSTLFSLNDSTLFVMLERTECYGTCPAYRLEVYRNGKVTYTGKSHVKVIGEMTKWIDQSTLQALQAAFTQAQFLRFKDNYTEMTWTDMPTTTLSFSSPQNRKTVVHYHGDDSAPKSLTDLENRIDEIVGTPFWIKGN
jgi:Domain of unknown function (DUF6438)